MRNIYNKNNKNQFHGYQERYDFNNKIYYRGNYKHNNEIGYEEHHGVKETAYYIC